MTDLVEAVVDALNRRDTDALLAHATPDFEYDLTRTESPLRGVYGRDEMPRVMDDFLGSFEDARYEPHEVIEIGDRLVIPFSTHFRARGGLEVRNVAVWVWEVRDRRLARVTLFQDRADALAAAGAPD